MRTGAVSRGLFTIAPANDAFQEKGMQGESQSIDLLRARRKAEKDETPFVFPLTPLVSLSFSFSRNQKKKKKTLNSRAQPHLHLRQEGRLRRQRSRDRRLGLGEDGRRLERRRPPLADLLARRNRRNQGGGLCCFGRRCLDAAESRRNAAAAGHDPSQKSLRPPRAQGQLADEPLA